MGRMQLSSGGVCQPKACLLVSCARTPVIGQATESALSSKVSAAGAMVVGAIGQPHPGCREVASSPPHRQINAPRLVLLEPWCHHG